MASQRFESFRRPEFDPAKHINNSEVHTLSYQKKLPKQPIPSLESTGKQRKRMSRLNPLILYDNLCKKRIVFDVKFKKISSNYEKILSCIFQACLTVHE